MKFNAKMHILDNDMAGKYLSRSSNLSDNGKRELMTDVVHRGQGKFRIGAVEVTGGAMQSGGYKIAMIGYAASVSGLGATAGVPLVALGNVAKFAGVGIEAAINYARGNHAKANYNYCYPVKLFRIACIASSKSVQGTHYYTCCWLRRACFASPCNQLQGVVAYTPLRASQQ